MTKHEQAMAFARTLMTEQAALAALVIECREWGLDVEQVRRIAADLPGEYEATLAQEAAE